MSGLASPIAFERHLSCSTEEAFAAYTGRIAEWWDAPVLLDRFAVVATAQS